MKNDNMRRACGAVVLVLGLSLAVPPAAQAALEIDITQGNVEPLPMAIAPFAAEGALETEIARTIETTLAADLRRAGLFRLINQKAFLDTHETNPDLYENPDFPKWRTINADALVTGRVTRTDTGRIQVDFRLWDVLAGRQMEGVRFFATRETQRRVAHLVADSVYGRLTGEKGYFDTRIVYVEETGPKHRRVKKLVIMDQDGHAPLALTSGKSLVLTPRFSPAAQEILYMSYAKRKPRVHLLNLDTGVHEVLGEFPGMTFAPRFSPDGRKAIMSLERGGNSDIHTIDLRTGETRALTNTAAIDTAPSYAPDGKRIAFESDRGGAQQIYVMNADGSDTHRISFGKGVYGTPVWSPRGDLIAFTKQHKGRFHVGVMRVDGRGERLLSKGFHNEGPSWSPNGRVIIFFRETPGSSGGPSIWSVDLTGRNERKIRTRGFSSDPAWSPLLTQPAP